MQSFCFHGVKLEREKMGVTKMTVEMVGIMHRVRGLRGRKEIQRVRD